jgi:hypothetical protein
MIPRDTPPGTIVHHRDGRIGRVLRVNFPEVAHHPRTVEIQAGAGYLRLPLDQLEGWSVETPLPRHVQLPCAAVQCSSTERSAR